MKNEVEWVKIGEVGVDSGQLIVCDPCYLKGWQDGEYHDVRRYKCKKTGRIFAYISSAPKKLGLHVDEYFNNYECVTSHGKTPNQHNADKEWESIEYVPEAVDFSYNGVSHKGNKPYKQMNYALGHTGLAVAFQSGLGDGCYDVMAKIYMGRVLEVKIVMASQEDLDEIAKIFEDET